MPRGRAAWLVAALVLAGCSKAAPPPVPAPNPAVPAPSNPGPTVAAPGTPAAYQPGEQHRQALALIRDEKWAEAAPILRTLVAAEPGNADAWNDLSFVEARRGRYPDAADAAQKALVLRPDFVYAQYNLGWALLNTQDWRLAKAPLEANSRALPDRPEPLYALGIWYEQAGDKDQALTFYRKAAALDYGPARTKVAQQSDQVARRAAADAAVARFPQAPPGVIRSVMEGYIPEGVTRKLVQVMPVRFDDAQPPLWAALVFDQYPSSVQAIVEVRTAEANVATHDGFKGSCALGSGATEVPVQLQAVPYARGEHLLMQVPGDTAVCAVKGDYAAAVYRTIAPVSVTSGGLDVGGQLLRFVPETSQYLPAANAEKLLALIGEVRATGATLKTTEAVSADVAVTGKPALALAWAETTDGSRRLMIAVKPDGQPAILHTAKATMSVAPHQVGQVVVPGHTFLVVATHQQGGPNGGDVLVLEYDKATGSFRQVFHAIGDGAGFTDKAVQTTAKVYRPQGGFDPYVTTYAWDESKGTFVAVKTELFEK